METEREQVISNLRACLISMKGGIPLTSLDRDYKLLVGTRIPYRKLGFDSLESFLRSIPNVSMSRRNGEINLDAIPSKNTEHLVAMVAKQKSVPKKLKAPPRAVQRRTAASHWKPPPIAAKSFRLPPRRSLPAQKSPPPPQVSVTLNTKQTSSKSSRQVFLNEYQDTVPSYQQHHGYDIPPRFQKPSIQNNEHYYMSSQVQSQNHVEAPMTFTKNSVSRSPTPPNSLGTPDCLNTSMSGLSIFVKNYSQNSGGNNYSVQTGGSNCPAQTSINNYSAQASSAPYSAQARIQRPPEPQIGPIMKKEKEIEKVDVLENASQDAWSDVIRLAEQLGWPTPAYKIISRTPKGCPPIYTAIIRVGDTKYNSYPEEHPLPDVALQIAAKRAVDKLTQPEVVPTFPITQDQDLVRSRVTKLVMGHPQGIWNTQIPVDYSSQFQESLPEQWLEIVRLCPALSVEHISQNRVILTPKNISSDGQTIPKVSPPWHTEHVFVNIPQLLELPSDDTWDVFVTSGSRTSEVWIRLIGEEYSEKYAAMSTDMEIRYMENAVKVKKPEVGCHYAIVLDDCWHRVRLEEISSKETGLIFFVDHGDEDLCILDDLYILEPGFSQLPAQAIPVTLCGLEDFADDPNVADHLVDVVIGRSFVASVIKRDPDISVTLYDTSTDEDVNVNELLAEKISQGAQAPSLPENGEISEVYVSYINAEGEVYLHVRSEGFKYLESLLGKLIIDEAKNPLVKLSYNHRCDPSKLYLAQYSVDNEFYRAAIVSKPDDNKQVMVQFVDYGNTEKTSCNKLMLLSILSEPLERFPHQAIKVHLATVPPSSFSQKVADRLRDIVGENEPVLVKVVKAALGGSPLQVEMFKRTEDKQLVSVNTTLSVELELSKPKVGDTRPRKRLQSQRSHPGHELGISQGQARGLPVPKIPEVGCYFDVIVTMAANPGNFTVRPFHDRSSLESQMKEMSQFYADKSSWQEVLREDVKEGGLFAALHHDNHWYRVTVSNLIGRNVVSVYFCDFGDVTVLSLDRLQPLAAEFRKLPAQAIKAKLSRIMPRHSDWSVDDCIVFQKLVMEKQFVSIVVDWGPDLLNPSDIVIGLQLIDTTGPSDVVIDHMLVEEKRAIYTSAAQQAMQ